MKRAFSITAILILSFTAGNSQDITLHRNNSIVTEEIGNSLFKQDKNWRGADGAATIDLENGNILWLFSDTFIDIYGTGSRQGSRMINNSIAIQSGNDIETAITRFYYGGTSLKPQSFFKIPGKNWLWTGHGAIADGKLIIFLFEEKRVEGGMGFEAVGWHVAVITNPFDNPSEWKIKYYKGPSTFGIIIGSSAVLKNGNYLYVYGVREPGNHDVFLHRFELSKVAAGNLSGIEWWTRKGWVKDPQGIPESAVLFAGQTEFSVTLDKGLEKYIQVQTYGFGKAAIGYRTAPELWGPWSDPVLFFIPTLNDPQEFSYTARAHPELLSGGLLVTYNINNFDFGKLLMNEDIYFPKIIKLVLKAPIY